MPRRQHGVTTTDPRQSPTSSPVLQLRLVVEARVDSTARIAFERECLTLVEARLAER